MLITPPSVSEDTRLPEKTCQATWTPPPPTSRQGGDARKMRRRSCPLSAISRHRRGMLSGRDSETVAHRVSAPLYGSLKRSKNAPQWSIALDGSRAMSDATQRQVRLPQHIVDLAADELRTAEGAH